MNRITDIKILEYYENKDFETRHGIYQCKFNNQTKFFVLSNNILYVLMHYMDNSRLDIVTDEVKNEFFNLQNLNEIY